jgi:hypothetical protein
LWRKILCFAVVFLLYSPPAYAYLDPGTGSALVYVIIGILLSAYFALRGLYHKTLELIFRIRFKNRKCTLAIHSEDPRYESTFLPVIRALARRNRAFSYFTMYERDGSFEPLPSQATHQTIPPGLVGYSYLNHLEAKLVLTTTPQLDVMTFRRSRRVKHYGYLSHALGEARYTRPFAFEFFDTVFCCGPLLKDNIRTLERVRGMPAKQLLETGIPHYDELARHASSDERSDDRPTVLIAPSWGPMSLFQVFGTGFVRQVAERYPVVVRPHPQMKISQAGLYEEILRIDGVTVDTAPSPSAVMSRAAILVSDISGIIYEFVFIHEKPVIIVDHKVGVEGLEGHLLGDTVSLREHCREFIVGLDPSDMPNLVDCIADVLARGLSARIAEARERFVYHYGRAGEVAADQIEEILRCV